MTEITNSMMEEEQSDEFEYIDGSINGTDTLIRVLIDDKLTAIRKYKRIKQWRRSRNSGCRRKSL